ncbi:penicillin-binding protein 2 [Parvularcula sp. IMCC14364]|uniref:peptidoglycan D,D-transpeptidase FtsI family protein n=1 Tax=Parvularcula sp. IMCC14364 TaxID=3067902 RepID=UPI0027417F76|nr:penicillin-binding protein 2 [Parvularcula sp. IMCC14364]
MKLPFIGQKKKPSARILHETQFSGLGEAGAAASLPVHCRASVRSREQVQVSRMRGRIWLCMAAFLAVFFGLSLRLADLTVLGTAEARHARTQSAPVAATERPLIVDRNLNRLAMNQEVVGAGVTTRDVWDLEETARKLTAVFPKLNEDSLRERLEQKKYIPLTENLSEDQYQKLAAFGLPGVEFVTSVKRVYPQGAQAAHVLGYTVPGRGGAAGLEKVVDLHTAEGPLVSSLDIRVQQILEEELWRTSTTFSAKAAWGIVMDVTSGEIIALASLPEYNPNEPGESHVSSWRNRAMYDVYELGSAFKILTAASALEAGVTDTTRLYDVRHPLKVRNRTISDYHPKGGFMTLTEVMQHSSNIGMARIALDLGADTLAIYLKALGMTSPLVTELPEQRAPLLPAQWGEVEMATISYGHGIAVTPLQLTAAVGAVINGGDYIQPTFLKRDPSAPQSRTALFSADTSATMRLMLRRVITDGTGRNADVPGYYVIGKTATADKPSPYGGYKKDERLSSFIGAFPGYDPRYVVLVSFDEPQPTAETYGYATAGVVAAPAFQRIVSRSAPLLGLQPVADDLAFAQFMSAFREKQEMRLALAPREAMAQGADVHPDQVAKLLAELGP